METRRRIDLCTCGQSRDAEVHGVRNTVLGHMFTNSQPPAPPAASSPKSHAFHRIHAVRINSVWITEVYGSGKMGHGQAKEWLTAVEAAIEDLKEKL